jgi:3-oxoacyl-[acyl-carrier protein] reductase
MDLELQGKVALVTGGSRGIGRAIALRLASEGSHVGICARTASPIEQTVNELQSYGVQACGSIADVTQPTEIDQFVQDSAHTLGGIDLLVANAGGTVGGRLLDSTPDDWRQTFELNLFHAINAIRSVVPHMQQRGSGSVLIIASISGGKPAPRSQYGAAKASEIFVASALAWELASDRIRVNTLSPGSIWFEQGGWDQFQRSQPDRFADFEQREFPWGRLGTLAEIADVAVFLLSERARWINGANIPVDGAQARPTVF